MYIAIVYMSRIVPGPVGRCWAALPGTLAGKLVMIRIASKIINWITIEIIRWITNKMSRITSKIITLIIIEIIS